MIQSHSELGVGGSLGPRVRFTLLPASLPPAFQEIFKLFSPSPTGTVDMRSMRAALRHVGIQLSPQEMCEALRQADLDGGCPHPWPLVLPRF